MYFKRSGLYTDLQKLQIIIGIFHEVNRQGLLKFIWYFRTIVKQIILTIILIKFNIYKKLVFFQYELKKIKVL